MPQATRPTLIANQAEPWAVASWSMAFSRMKVTGSNSMSPLSGARPGKAQGAQGGFSLPSAGPAASATRASGMSGVNSLDALIALQDIGGPLERRRRAVGRAGRILDVLDDLKLALLDGELSPASLERLARAVREERGATDDPRLEGVLDEIETRAAVELAKLEQVRHAA